MSTANMVIDATVEINEGCPINLYVSGSNRAYLTVGEGPKTVELAVDMEAMRTLANVSTEGIRQMDTRYEHEENHSA